MKTVLIWAGLALLAFIVYVVWFPPKKTDIDYDRDAIGYCWKEYERKSNSPEVKLIIAKSCEDAEAKFIKTYNRKP